MQQIIETKLVPEKQCLWCGAPVKRKGIDPRQKMPPSFCCRICSARYHAAQKPRKEMPAPKPKKPKTLICLFCGCEFLSHQPKRTYCSDECRKERNRRQSKARYKRLPVFVIGTLNCKYCGKQFDVLSNRSSKVYCSIECSSAAELQKGRARDRIRASKTKKIMRTGVRIDPISLSRLHKRDNGKCGICGKKVDLGLHRGGPHGPHLMSATRDHIIPTSEGGEHTWENVRLAHFLCNSKRGTSGNVQTVLFG